MFIIKILKKIFPYTLTYTAKCRLILIAICMLVYEYLAQFLHGISFMIDMMIDVVVLVGILIALYLLFKFNPHNILNVKKLTSEDKWFKKLEN